MNYEKMIAVKRIESEQKIKLATMAIEQLIERGEYPYPTFLLYFQSINKINLVQINH